MKNAIKTIAILMWGALFIACSSNPVDTVMDTARAKQQRHEQQKATASASNEELDRSVQNQ